MKKIYSMDVSKTGVITLDEYVAPVRDMSLGSIAVVCIADKSDDTVNCILSALSETKTAFIKVVNMKDMNKDEKTGLERKLRATFPFRNVMVNDTVHTRKDVIQLFNGSEKEPDICLLDEGAFKMLSAEEVE